MVSSFWFLVSGKWNLCNLHHLWIRRDLESVKTDCIGSSTDYADYTDSMSRRTRDKKTRNH